METFAFQDDDGEGEPPLLGVQWEGWGVHQELDADIQQRGGWSSQFKNGDVVTVGQFCEI